MPGLMVDRVTGTRRYAPPLAPRRFIQRPRVLQRLADAKGTRVICLQAPGGYGKTTALAQWLERDPRPAIWLGVRPAAANAEWLVQALLDALAALGLVSERVPVAGSVSPAVWQLSTLPLVEATVGAVSEPFVVAVDDAGLITGTAWESLVESIATSLPAGSQLVLATRDAVPATLWRLRGAGQAVVLDPTVLVFDESETRQVLDKLGVASTAGELGALMDYAGGWPVALYLAALSIQAQPGRRPPTSVLDSAGLAEYLREDVVGRLDADDATFLARVSVLASLDPACCDEVGSTTGSLARLRRLADTNHLLVTTDRAAEKFRMHPLLAEALGEQLHENDPEGWRLAHLAASQAEERRGDSDGAVHHAKLAGDDERLASIVWSRAPSLLASGQWAVLERWLADVDEGRLTSQCRLALSAAWVASHAGDMPRMSRLALAARNLAMHEEEACLLDVGLLDATIGAAGLDHIESAARAYIAGRGCDDAWQTLAQFLVGVALVLRDETEQGMAALNEGHHLAVAQGFPVMAAHCLASLADTHLAGGETHKALSLVRESRQMALEYRMDSIATTAPIFTTSAVGYALEGRLDDARSEATRALRLTALMRFIAPWHAVQGRLALAQVNLMLGDLARAKVLTEEAGDLRGATSSSPRLDRMYAETVERLSAVPTSLAGGSSLTTAEVRVIQYLPTHLSFPQIAEELFVSRHTVKTQAMSIYNKLGVHSRSDAIDQARRVGLLPPEGT